MTLLDKIRSLGDDIKEADSISKFFYKLMKILEEMEINNRDQRRQIKDLNKVVVNGEETINALYNSIEELRVSIEFNNNH